MSRKESVLPFSFRNVSIFGHSLVQILPRVWLHCMEFWFTRDEWIHTSITKKQQPYKRSNLVSVWRRNVLVFGIVCKFQFNSVFRMSKHFETYNIRRAKSIRTITIYHSYVNSEWIQKKRGNIPFKNIWLSLCEFSYILHFERIHCRITLGLEFRMKKRTNNKSTCSQHLARNFKLEGYLLNYLLLYYFRDSNVVTE